MKLLLTKRQEEILVGSILGDGYLVVSSGGNTSFRLSQKESSKDYVFWFFNELKGFCRSNPKQRKDNGQWYFLTRYLSEFNAFRHIFYPKNKKIVPENIEDILLSPLSLAIWYMDDGTLDYRPNYHCSFSLSTHSFSLEGAQKLAKVLKDNFRIEATVSNNLIRGKRYPRIYIGKNGRDRFIELVSPFVLDCFKYKLPQHRQPLRDFSRIKMEGWQVQTVITRRTSAQGG